MVQAVVQAGAILLWPLQKFGLGFWFGFEIGDRVSVQAIVCRP